ncbi:hypothetical protein, partial [Adlercreutzia equolifaciens]|uniref:hypothetical protein n=1 Tax=Adlercreutzia equolifaciens TaxID=446660 RepID=UPI00242FD338
RQHRGEVRLYVNGGLTAGIGKCAFLILKNALFDLRKLEKSQLRKVNKKAHFPILTVHENSSCGRFRAK